MIEQLKNIARKAIEEQIKENIDSALIFKYVSDLENENKELRENRDKAIEILKLCNSKCSKEVIEILRGDI